MTKQRFLIAMVLCVVLCCSVLLTACGKGTIDDSRETSLLDVIAEDATKPTLSFKEITKTDLDGVFVSGDGYFFYTREVNSSSTVYNVYDSDTFEKIYSFTDATADNFSFNSFSFGKNRSFFTIVINTSNGYETRLIDRTGKEIVSKDYRADLYVNDKMFSLYGLFTFAGDVYKQEDGSVTLVKESNAGYTNLNNALIYGNDYFWVNYSSGSSLSRIAAYDTSLTPVAEYVFPSYAKNPVAYGIGNNRIFIQYLVSIDPQVVEYDLEMDGTKYNVHQFVYNPEKQELNNVDINGIVKYCINQFDDFALDMDAPYLNFEKNFNLSAIASVAPIVDKHVDNNNPVFCNLGDNGLVSEIIQPLAGSTNLNVQILGKNRYMYFNDLESAYQIIDDKGKVYGSFKSYTSINDSFILVDNVIYNFDFKKVYEIKEDDEITFAQSSVYIISHTSYPYYNFYLLKSGDTALSDPFFSYSENNDARFVDTFYNSFGHSESLSEYIFAVKYYRTGETIYKYYNSTTGDEIGSSYNLINYCTSSNDGNSLLFSITKDGETSYYKMN